MPSIGWTKVEQHPFSFANSPVEGQSNDAVFLIKAEQGGYNFLLIESKLIDQASRGNYTTKCLLRRLPTYPRTSTGRTVTRSMSPIILPFLVLQVVRGSRIFSPMPSTFSI
jgi:hypothetical protein